MSLERNADLGRSRLVYKVPPKTASFIVFQFKFLIRMRSTGLVISVETSQLPTVKQKKNEKQPNPQLCFGVNDLM